MCNKTIIKFGFCDIQNNQGLGKGYQPQPSATADNTYLDKKPKTSSNDCLVCNIIEINGSLVVSSFCCY